MNSRMETNAWFCRTVIVLGFMFAASLARTIVLILRGQPPSQLLLVLGAIAAAGIIQLLSSPWNRGF